LQNTKYYKLNGKLAEQQFPVQLKHGNPLRKPQESLGKEVLEQGPNIFADNRKEGRKFNVGPNSNHPTFHLLIPKAGAWQN